MIEVKNLCKTYGHLKAIDQISFSISKGDIVGFLGPNGAGKTTTMKILTGYMPAQSGTVLIDGLSMIDHSLKIRKRMGYLPENNPLYTDMRVIDYLSFVAELRSLRGPDKKASIDRVVDLCQLSQVVYSPIEELSKGFCQRVGLAQALIHHPDILILDEPTSGLDPHQIIEMRELIKTLEGVTVILCSHILSEVQATCDRLFILNKGHIIADGTPKSLATKVKAGVTVYAEIDQPLSVVTQKVTSQLDMHSIDSTLSSEGFTRFTLEASHDIRKELFLLAKQENWVLRELSMQEQDLESIFLSLTTEKK
ncbi:MAG: ATP-binding cassette domain-containing protein [Candidatus Margulisbacteria bacterium]|nr:ATP-binding cassette domain-containing protein [Candidatus Margulisiibacteriota bacterium]